MFLKRVRAALFAMALLGTGCRAAEAVAPVCPGRPTGATPLAALGADGPRLLIDRNFPDPFVARFGGDYHAYATGAQLGAGTANVQHVRSADLANWTAPAEALTQADLPAWVDRRHPQVWAPEVVRHGDRYLLYFNARHRALTRRETPPDGPRVLRRHCLGVAVARRPEGPFRGVGAPLVCAEFADGVIDAHVFADRGRLFLYYKDDGNCCGRGSAIYGQALRPDGLAVAGPPRRLLANDDSPEPHDDWEWRVVEAPTMMRRGDAYYLFYSGNYFGNKNYAVGYLRCASPLGPCRDGGDNPILWSHPGSPLVGPGHQSILPVGGRDLFFFHGWNRDPDGRERPGVHRRCLYVSELSWERRPDAPVDLPVVAGGSPTARP